MMGTPDPRLSLPLKKPAKLRDTVMALFLYLLLERFITELPK